MSDHASISDVLEGRARWCVVTGDCLAVLTTIPAGSVGAVLTDLPYGIGLRNGDVDGHRSERSFNVAGDEDQSLGLQVLEWARSEDRMVAAFASPWKPWPGRWRNLIVWDKGGAVGGGGDIATCLKRSWELLQVWNPDPIVGPRAESVWRCAITAKDTEDHICAKPVPLLTRLIQTFIPRGAIVIDPTCGCGPVGVAAMMTGHPFIGIEREAHYADIARRRISDAADTLWTPPAPKPEQLELCQ